MTARRLRVVDADPPLDVTLAMRSEIEKRDWESVHIAGDRNKPVRLPSLQRVWRVWR